MKLHEPVDIDSLLRSARLMAVLTIEKVEHAVPLARALAAGGVRALEVTLRTEAAIDSARAITAEVPESIVGLGTVLTKAELDLVRRLGLRFAVTPGATPELLDAAAATNVPLVPGIATASELMAAMARGFNTVKFFPAEASGGTAALKAFAGPFPQARFCPTGGISEDKVAPYLALPNVLIVGASFLAPAAEIAAGNWDAITARAAQAMRKLG